MHTMESPAFRIAPPNSENVYLADKVRITLVTDRLFRFEYAEDGKFEDRETLAVLNRDLGPVAKSITLDDDGCRVIDTGYAVIRHRADGRKFSRRNLSVSFTLNGAEVEWFPGKKDTGNLKGTARTLDCCDGDWHCTGGKRDRKLRLCDGFLSRDGWSVFDDHDSVVLSKVGGRKWIVPRAEKEYQDFYLFVYGHDYKAALAAAAGVFGSQPLAPRYTLGYWYSRYWAHTDADFDGLLDEMDRADAPIDVVVVDMDWHLEGWTGYTWDKRYFPDPDEFLAEMHRRGCRVSLNLHPADGVGRQEAQFEAMAKAMGADPKKTDRIPFAITDPKYMKNYFEILHHPEEKRGVDFWWMDWQQGTTTPMRNLDTLPWLNHLHWEDMQKQGKRPLIFSRFGGVGAGRYVIGFSGDTYSNWRSLAYQPYFTATAANILFGYWSHDIGGHMPGEIDPELYLRWMQFGAWSPILRTHTTKQFLAERRFSAFPDPCRSLMLQAIRDRYERVPYIYSENRRALDTGISLVAPLYYDWPEEERAYSEKKSYLFGSQFLVSPVVKPVDPETDLADEEIWLPEGEWFDTAHGQLLKGGKVHHLDYLIGETPVFARAGAIVPGQRGVRRLNAASYPNLVVTVFPGKAGSYDLYEDDGVSADYLEANHVTIRLEHAKAGRTRVVTVRHTAGIFAGFLKKRELEFRFPAVIPPESVVFNGEAAKFVYRFESEESRPAWRYDGNTATLIVRTAAADLDKGAELRVTYAAADEFAAAAGLAGKFRRLALVAKLANALTQIAYRQAVDERLGQELAHTGNRVSRVPETFTAELRRLKKKLPELPAALKKQAEIVTASRSRSRYTNFKWLERPLAVALELLRRMEA